MGMWLPNAEQIEFFKTNIEITKEVLEERLSDTNSDVRQRAAYVVEEIGPAARPLQNALVTALVKERDSIVRIYLCNALREIGGGDESVLAELRSLFDVSGENKAVVGQRIYAGAALATLSKDPGEVADCTAFVCQWLKPPSENLSPAEVEQYWDARWSAVNAIEHVPSARQAVPLLEDMLNEPGKHPWVDIHVPRALASLKKTPVVQPKRIVASVKWSPPANPDPQQILNEAQSDAMSGRYEDALAKHVWFHENALKIRPSLYGVRLSFALGYWQQLGIVYPAAKDKLIEIRDEAVKRVSQGDDARAYFHDFESINDVLGDDDRTVRLFISLEKDQPKLAAEVFDIAQPALVRAGEFKVCGKYIDPERDFHLFVREHRVGMQLAEDSQIGEAHIGFAQQKFANEVSTLVALLVVCDRKAEAAEIAARAKEIRKDDGFAAELDDALKGKVPEPWP